MNFAFAAGHLLTRSINARFGRRRPTESSSVDFSRPVTAPSGRLPRHAGTQDVIRLSEESNISSEANNFRSEENSLPTPTQPIRPGSSSADPSSRTFNYHATTIQGDVVNRTSHEDTHVHGNVYNVFNDPQQADIDDIVSQVKELVSENARKYGEERNYAFDVEEDIATVNLQISSEVKTSNDYGHYNRREEILRAFEVGQGDIRLESLFAFASETADLNIPRRFTTEGQKEQYMKIYRNIIGLTGQAGIGKTTITRVITMLVLNGQVLPNTEWIFNVKFRDVVYDREISLWDFLTSSLRMMPLDEKTKEKLLSILYSSEHVFVTLDGLDEAECDDLSSTSPRLNLYDKALAIHHARNLLRGESLPNAKVILTSRPHQLYLLDPEYRPKLNAEVLGLDEQNQARLGRQITGEDKYEPVMAYLTEHPDFSSMCFVPAKCFLVYGCVSKMISERNEIRMRCVTGLMVFALLYYLKSDHVKSDQVRSTEMLPKLSKLAWNGVQRQKVVFMVDEFDECNIQLLSLGAFLHTYVDRDSNLHVRILDGEKRMSFSHLTWQEIFSAFMLMLIMSPESFSQLLLILATPQMEVVVKFCFGICNSEVQKQLRKIFPFHKVAADKRHLLKQLAIEHAKSRDESPAKAKDNWITACIWANEARCDDITRAVADHLPKKLDLSDLTVLPNDAFSFAFVIETAGRSFDVYFDNSNFIRNSFSLFLSSMTSLAIGPHSSHQSANERVRHTPSTSRVQDDSPDDVTPSARFFIRGQESRDDVIGAATSRRLANTVQCLDLYNCKLALAHVRELAATLKKLKIPITHLDLSRNEIGDQGASELADVIEKIEMLVIRKCNITPVGAKKLREKITALPDPIKLLNLSHNEIGDEGASELGGALGKIDELVIEKCGITRVAVRELRGKIAALPFPQPTVRGLDSQFS